MTKVDIDKLIESATTRLQDHRKEGELVLQYALQTTNDTTRAEMCRRAGAAFDRASATNLILTDLFAKRRSTL